MDVNGQTYWVWSRPEDVAARASTVAWTDEGLMLTPTRTLPVLVADLDAARAAAAGPPSAVDGYGTWARVTEDGRTVLAGGVDEPEMPIFDAATTVPGAAQPVLAAVPDGIIRDLVCLPAGGLVLAVAPEVGDGAVIWLDLLDRFDPVTLTEAGFAPDRVAAAVDGTVWLVDRGRRRVRLLRGQPFPRPVALLERAAFVFAPEPENTDPPRLHASATSVLPDDGLIMDVTADDQGRLLVLSVPADEGDAVLRRLDQTTVGAPMRLSGAVTPFSLGWYGPGEVALLFAGGREAVAYEVGGGQDWQDREHGVVLPTGVRLPLRGWSGGRLCNSCAGRLHYQRAPREVRERVTRIAPLAALSLPSFARAGTADLTLIDADHRDFVWHRLYLEAILPTDCGVTVRVGASNDRDGLLAGPEEALHPHHFGTVPDDGTGRVRGVWLDQDSERPFLRSALTCDRRRDTAGLFTCLLQRGDGAVPSRIVGRYLRIRVTVTGNGRATPKLAAVRAWGPRFSYRDRYLPELFTVTEGPLAAGSDFLDRYLALFESVLTPLEDQIAVGYRLTTPETAPADALTWLAGWIGAPTDTALSEAQQRRLIAHAVSIWRWRGTLRGLQQMLDIATDDGVRRGELVVVEHFRLRRTFATILGADLSQPFDPLTRGTAVTANSHLGPTFFLGDEDQRRFFALFRPSLLEEPLTTAAERAQALEDIDALVDQDAFHVTVLMHGPADPERHDLVARVIARETPAHVVTRLHQTSASLIAGLTALLAVDSYVGPALPLPGFTIGAGLLGQGTLRDTPALDPRLEGGL